MIDYFLKYTKIFYYCFQVQKIDQLCKKKKNAYQLVITIMFSYVRVN